MVLQTLLRHSNTHSLALTMHFQDIPHKNLLVSAVIAVLAVSATFYLTQDERTARGERMLTTQAIPEIKEVAGDIDTDHDGLPDWKEKLYGSDMNVLDSDNDGTGDGDEVRIGRNPALPNTAKQGEAATDKFAYLEDPNIATSSTDLLGIKKEFFARYLAEGSKEIKETTYRDLIRRADVKKFIPKHELLDLSISSDNRVDAIREYVNAFGDIIEKYSSHRMEQSEDALIEAVMETKNKEAGEELQLLSLAYRNFSSDLLNLTVPSGLARAHLLIVNGYAGMGDGLFAVVKIRENPVDGTAGYQAYLTYRLDVINGYALIVAHIANQSIVFTPEEAGYPFYKSATIENTGPRSAQ